MRTERFELPLGIGVVDPVPGLAMALQRGHGETMSLVRPQARWDTAIAFAFEVTVDGSVSGGGPRLLGHFVQGPPAARFVYLSVGRYADQAASEWGGRVKVPLSGIAWEVIEAKPPGARLVALISGRSPQGGPALASVRLLPPGWTWRP